MTRTLLAPALLLLAACAPPPPVVLEPAPDPQQLALALEDKTSLEEPIRVIFDWELNEAGVRVHGRGVARIEPPYRARLDLFLGNGETVVSAALVGTDLRLPRGAPDDILPPADLMWGVLGVFHPQYGTELLGADRLEGGDVQLRYRYEDARELHFRVQAGRVQRLELFRQGSVVERVILGLDDGNRYPLEATYRNLAAFRELKITREKVDRVEPFPPDIWDPAEIRGARRGAR